MIETLRRIASLKLTLVGMAALALVALAAAGEAAINPDYAAIPIVLLAVNLLAALITNRSFRTQTGLLVFHLGLLLVFVLTGLTVLTRFDGRVEVVQGGEFEASSVQVNERGWLHAGRLGRVQFTQGDIRIDYLPQLLRQDTRSTVLTADANGRPTARTIGDRDTMTLEGYRIAATFNKGFAVIFGWHASDGRVEYGSVHFPSFPENDWNQRIDWITPAGERLELELELGAPLLRVDEAWTLGRTDMPFTVRISGREEALLAEGESATMAGGIITVEDLRLWMGYRVDYLPLLPWMVVAAFLAIGGLAMHYRSQYLRDRRQPSRAATRKEAMADVAAA